MRGFLLIFIILLMLILFMGVLKSLEYNILVGVTVLPIYKLSINIDILTKVVAPEENLSVFIKLEKIDLTNISKEISVDLNYEIIKGKKIVEKGILHSINITDKKEEIMNIPIYSNLQGRYILKIITSHPQSYSDEDSKMFVVKKKIMFGFLAKKQTFLNSHFLKNL